MIHLILKDYVFARKQMLIAVLYCLIAPVLLIMDGGSNKYSYWVQFLIPFCLISIPMGKIFYMENCSDDRYFLRQLPHGVYKRVASRFCFMAITLIVSEIYLCLIQYIIFRQSIGEIIKNNAIPMIVFLVYYSLYIMLAYNFGYMSAQNTIHICVAVIGIWIVAYEKLALKLDLSVLTSFNVIILFAMIGIGIITFAYYFSCKGERKRGSYKSRY